MIDYIKVNKYSSVPLYDQIRSSLEEAIKGGKLKAGDKLPTEEEVCKYFAISRPVVRQAYSELIKAGLIVRERGRGTFVKELDNRQLFMKHVISFHEEMRLQGKVPYTKMLESGFWKEDDRIFSVLKIPEGGRCYYLERLRYGDGRPFEHVYNYLPYERFPGLEKYDFGKNSLYETLKADYGVKIVRAHRSLQATRATAKQAELLGLPRSATLLVIESAVYDQNDQPVELSIESIAGDSHRYDFDVYND